MIGATSLANVGDAAEVTSRAPKAAKTPSVTSAVVRNKPNVRFIICLLEQVKAAIAETDDNRLWVKTVTSAVPLRDAFTMNPLELSNQVTDVSRTIQSRHSL